jgi:hypothetical protein
MIEMQDDINGCKISARLTKAYYNDGSLSTVRGEPQHYYLFCFNLYSKSDQIGRFLLPSKSLMYKYTYK